MLILPYSRLDIYREIEFDPEDQKNYMFSKIWQLNKSIKLREH